MNRFLLDTHIWVWNLVNLTKLSQEVRDTLRDDEAQLWLSPISLWEVSLLHKKGRLDASIPLASWFSDALRQYAIQEAPVTYDVIRALETVETPHKDPADRFLAATAAALDLTLITSDRNLLAGRGYKTLSNL